jgi:anaerobic magnesium-protoporphyrin IX monomethyl ester cyclase
MNIGLIFPNKDRRYKTVHLGLGYIAAYARQHHPDLNFCVLDTRVATKKETNAFFKTQFDLIGITVFAPVYYEVVSIFNLIKSKSNTPVCLGGPYVTTIEEDVFIKTPAEYAVYGEGEITFTELISHLKGEKNIQEIDGLMYKDGSGNIVRNRPRAYIQNIDSLPLPAYELFPMDRYPLHRMVTTRGCPYACAFCNASSIWENKCRMRSPAEVVSEIEFLIAKYGKKIFIFGDNTFNVDKSRVEAFCDLLIEKKIKILWAVNARADHITLPLALKMKEAGCYNVAIGVESANNEVLRRISKKTSIEKVTEGIKIFKQAGIEVLGQFVIGSPYDTKETVMESINYAKNSPMDFVNFYTILPFKGTTQWDYIAEHGTFFGTSNHDYHTVKPRIVFETPEFPFSDRLEVIKAARKLGYYSNKDKKNILFDFAKEFSRRMQNILPQSISSRVYRVLKSIYQIRLIKKNNPG